MIRKLALAMLAVGVMALVDAGPVATAGPISPSNPYRSFNFSGVNYGSMRWERTHGGRMSAGPRWGHRGGGLLFRRR